MTQPPASIARIVWEGLGKGPELASALFGAGAILWIAGIALHVGSAFVGRDQGLAHLAFPLMQAAWMTGALLSTFATVVLSPTWRAGALERHRRHRFLRWLESPEATFVDLSGAARERARRGAVDTAGPQQPDASVIAMPVFAALGAACFGFAGAMVLANAAFAPPSLVLEHRHAFSLFWGIMLLLFLLTSLNSVGRASLRVFGWASDRAAAAARAQADVERARLGALQAQMNPHFLFNTLNTVAALAGADSARAESVVEHLSAVLRHSLQRADRPFTSVEDEVRFAREYLDVEQARLGVRLRVSWNIGADTAPLRVPTMCLLPLIENAIAYAVDPRPEGGRIQVSSVTTAGGYLLRLSVEDDGPGFPADMKDGRGLAELRQRLWAEYERTYELDTETLPAGARATLSLPATRFKAPVAGRRGNTEETRA